MRFFHPGGDLSRWSPGSSRRRRERIIERNRVVQTGPDPIDRATPDTHTPAGALYLASRTKVEHNGVQYIAGQKMHGPVEALEQARRKGDAWRVQPSGIDWWTAPGRVLAVEPCDAVPMFSTETPGALRIAVGCGYDPGNAVYRMHSAINEHTKHTSAFVAFRTRDGNPFRCPSQYDQSDPDKLRALIYEADVLYHHVDYFLRNAGIGNRPRPKQLLIRHYHGSLQASRASQYAVKEAVVDDALGSVLLGARLTLCALRPGRIKWMPITVPVDRYASMVTPRPDNVLRIAHSATKDVYKGTRDLIDTVDELTKKGLKIELVLIGYERTGRKTIMPSRRTHAEALRMKASCHVTVDSVHWLGLQGSGLEAAAMGQAALAGDADVADLYRAEFGTVPYTHIEGTTTQERRKSLKELLERLATDRAFLRQEADRAERYVREVHDYPAVARRFEGILAEALGRSDVLTQQGGVH